MDPKQKPSRAVGARVRALRRDRDWTMDDLSERLAASGTPMSRVTIGKIECGHNQGSPVTVSVEQLVAFAAVFGATLDSLVAPFTCEVCANDPSPGMKCMVCGLRVAL